MSEERKNSETLSLASVVDRHRGQKFLICGTGPSIDQFPKSFYEGWEGVTIGVNDILELFTPRYHINIHESPGIIRDNIENVDLVFRYHNPSTQIDPEKSGLLSMVGTVALTAMTAAYQLGASEIYLIGIDLKATPECHHFKGCSSALTIGGTHVIQHTDELRATLRSFDRALKLYRNKGVKVVNLSMDSLVDERRDERAFSSSIDKHKGSPFLVCGTGPSIDQFPKSFYDEWPGVTIGVNKIIERFIPDYLINIHERENIVRDNIEGTDLSFRYYNPSAQIDVEKSGLLSMVGTVALTAMTAAYQMGASEIHLIGIDLKITSERHHFKGCTTLYWDEENPLPPGHGLEKGLAETTHLFNEKNQLEATIRGFDRATRLYKAQGVKIINLSDDSLVEVA